MNVTRSVISALAMLIAGAGCSKPEPLRLGAEELIVETGLADALREQLARDTHRPVEIVPGNAETIATLAKESKIDFGLLTSLRPSLNLACGPHAIRSFPVAREELVFYGPSHSPLTRTGTLTSAVFMDDIGRSSQLFLKGRKGTLEHEKFVELWKTTGLREGGNILETKLDGVELLKLAVERKGMALVRRSAMVIGFSKLNLKGRVWLSNRPDLALTVYGFELPRECTGEAQGFGFLGLVRQSASEAAIEKVGESFGYRIFTLTSTRAL